MPPPWLITTPTAPDTSSPLAVKWTKGTTPVSAISKISVSIQIPAFTCGTWACTGYSVRVAQFNFSLPSSFTLVPRTFVNFIYSLGAAGIVLTVRYRIGTQGFRYLLNPQLNIGEFPRFTVPGLLYTGQIIKPNFVIEAWTPSAPDSQHQIISIPTVTNIQTSIVQLPEASPLPSIVSPAVSIVTTLTGSIAQTQNDLFYAAFPFQFNNPVFTVPTNGPWLDNTP